MKNFKKTNEYYSYARPEMVDFVPKDAKTILDVGCGEGMFALSLSGENNDLETWGIEINQKIAEIAKKNLDKVLIGDVDKLINELPDSYFDCVIFNDVLEHMVNPYSILAVIKKKLRDNGVVVCSIPNVRHVRVLRDLLFKKQWKYEDAGILDRTHLRFFTKRSIIDMFNDLDYEILKIQGIHATKLWMFIPISIITLGFFSDSRYIQFACLVRPKNK